MIWPAVVLTTAVAWQKSARRAFAEVAIPTVATAKTNFCRFARDSPIRFLAYLLVSFSFLFMAFPRIDLAVSGLFAAPGGGFPLSDDATLIAIRDFNRLVPKLLLSSLLAVLLLYAFRPLTSWLVRPHQALYVLAVYAIGGGGVVHALKNFVGRARPEDTVIFGGNDLYTVAWQLSGACERNCSFSSGEAASAIAMLTVAVIVPKLMRPAVLAVLVPIAILFSVNRIAFGSHFLSDVVISWILVSIVAVSLHRLIVQKGEVVDRAIIGSGLPLVAWLGRRLRSLLKRETPGAPIPPQ